MNSLSYENSVLKENESTTSLKKDLRNINLNYANKIYSNFDNIEQDDCNVSYVENNDLKLFVTNYEKLEKSIDNDDKFNDTIHDILSYFRNYRFQIPKTPLPFNHLIFQREPLNEIINKINGLKYSYPHYHLSVQKLLEQLIKMTETAVNPLFDKLIRFYPEGLLYFQTSSRFLEVKKFIEERSNNKIIVVSGKELKKNFIEENLCIIGYPTWIKRDLHIFEAPKFKKLYCVTFGFLNSSKNDTPKLNKTVGSKNIHSIPQISSNKNIFQKLFDTSEDSDSDIEKFELEYFRNKSNKFSQNDIDYQNSLNAKMFIFSDNRIAYMTNEKGIDSSQRTIEIDFQNKPTIRKKQIDEFRRGDVVVLRIGSSKDLMVEIADKKILKSEIERNSQKKWKTALEHQLRKRNLDKNQLARDLKNIGINYASGNNISYWMSSEKNIKLDNDNLFLKLLNFLEFSEVDSKKILDDMIKIRSSHLQASKFITKELTKIIKSSDLNNLYKNGSQEFEIGDTGAKIGLFIVQAIDNNNVKMPRKYLDRILDKSDFYG